MERTELKSCPFCGAEAIIHYPAHNTVAVLCSKWKCGATIQMCDVRNIEKVIERWNRRADNGRSES